MFCNCGDGSCHSHACLNDKFSTWWSAYRQNNRNTPTRLCQCHGKLHWHIKDTPSLVSGYKNFVKSPQQHHVCASLHHTDARRRHHCGGKEKEHRVVEGHLRRHLLILHSFKEVIWWRQNRNSADSGVQSVSSLIWVIPLFLECSPPTPKRTIANSLCNATS